MRFYLTNAASSRTFNVSFGGAPIKVVASDVSRFEREALVPSVVLAPAERYVVEVRFDRPGRYALVNAVQAINHYRGEFHAEVDTLGVVTVDASAGDARLRGAVRHAAHERRRVAATSTAIGSISTSAPDKRSRSPCATAGAAARHRAVHEHRHRVLRARGVGGRDARHELALDGEQVRWILRDDATGKENMDIDWHVERGSVVKLRIFNDPKSFHPMQHPIHLHGQRMLVVARDGVPTQNLVWKDTAIIPVGSRSIC